MFLYKLYVNVIFLTPSFRDYRNLVYLLFNATSTMIQLYCCGTKQMPFINFDLCNIPTQKCFNVPTPTVIWAIGFYGRSEQPPPCPTVGCYKTRPTHWR